MVQTSSRLPLLMTAILLATLITWTPSVAAEGSPVSNLQAQGINALFDQTSESTTVYWSNIATTDFTLMTQMQQTRYLLYRHSGPLNASVIAENSLMPWGNISACMVGQGIAQCPGSSFQFHFLLPAGTNGTFYYAITTYDEVNETSWGNFIHGEANVSGGVAEFTNSITAPFFVQAGYDPVSEDTMISWVNLNTIVPDSLPMSGDAAYKINIYRHGVNATRANWATLGKVAVVMMLDASTTGYVVTIPPGTNQYTFYTVTYDYQGYEDVRFLGTNTMIAPIHEDNVAPIPVTGVQAHFGAESTGGTGNTTITWNDIAGEIGETYHIWRAGMPISNTNALGVELIGEMPSGFGFYRHEVARGMLGLAYYAVTASDSNGNHNTSVAESAALSLEDAVEEDTFTPWVAEPTFVFAEYLGYGQSRITWNDQLGVEGETYHVWRSNVRLTSLSNLELVAELIATVPDSVETATVLVPPNLDRSSYYCVSSLARYSHSAQPYEDLRFQQNCWGPIDEDTLRPSLPFLQYAEMTDQGGAKITLLQWVNDITEVSETYQLWVHHGDPFGGDESITSGDILLDSGWQPILEPVFAQYNNEPDFTRSISLEAGLDQATWYAVTTTDQYGNENTQFSASMNMRMVVEDTSPANIVIEVTNAAGDVVEALRAGQYTISIYADEPLAEYPIINLTTIDFEVDEFGTLLTGHAFTEQTATVRASPIPAQENAYRYEFEIIDTLKTSEIRVILIIRDTSQNVGTFDVIGWSIDAKLPEINVYAPGPSSLYLYGDSIHVYGAVTDDVEIAAVEIKFRYREKGLMRETEWINMTDLTPHETDSETMVFEWWEPAATFYDPGNQQRVYIRVIDTSGNEANWETVFTVDHCLRVILDFETACVSQSNVEPPAPLEAGEESFYEGIYLMVYALGAVNLVLLIVAMMSLILGSGQGKKKKKGEEDEEDDDDEWMMEFMGGGDSGGDDASGSPEDVRADMDALSDGASERVEVDDPFAASEGRDRKRRTKKSKSDAEETAEELAEEEEDEGDDFDDEDDDWDDEDEDEESAPKKKAVRRRKKTKRKAVRRK
jgi:hypothetical protein